MSKNKTHLHNYIIIHYSGVIYSPTDVKFKGVLVEARQSGENATMDLRGSFQTKDNTTHTTCGQVRHYQT